MGDSRAILSVNGLAEPLSYDHKPANEAEAARIIAAGGWVEFNRVNGNLALSRALGDFIFKRNDVRRSIGIVRMMLLNIYVYSAGIACRKADRIGGA